MTERIAVLVPHASPARLGDAFARARKVAFTEDAMLALEAAGLPHETLDTAYPLARFRQDARAMIADAQHLFARLDKAVEPEVGVERAYTSNAYWWLNLFANLQYVETIARRWREQAGEITFYAPREMHGVAYETASVRLAPDELRMPGSVNGLATKVAMFQRALSPAWREADSRDAAGRLAFRAIALRDRARRIPRKLRELRRRRAAPGEAGGQVVHVLQGGYEVDALQPHMPRTRFVEPMPDILREARGTPAIPLDDAPLEEAAAFVRARFPSFETTVMRALGDYHREVLGRVPALRRALDARIRRDRPCVALYSTGAHSIHEHVAAQALVAAGVPIVYFEHGGTASLVDDSPFFRHLDDDPDVPRLNVFQSKRRAQRHRGRLAGEALGSVRLHRIHQREPGASRRVLYVPSYLNFENYKDLLFNVPDGEMLRTHRAVVAAAARHGVELDVKVHSGGQVRAGPTSEETNYLYFRRLAAAHGAGHARVIAGGAAEPILPRYGTLVLDYVGTALLSVAIAARMQVIFFLKDESLLPADVLADLARRLHIVRDDKELDDAMRRHAAGSLDANLELDVVDRYAFPVAEGDPAPRIAQLVARAMPPEGRDGGG